MRPKTYWRTLIKSFTNPEYYLDILKAPFSFSLKFYLLSFIFFAIISSIKFAQVTAPEWFNYWQQSKQEIAKYYPQDLIIDWNQETLNINQADDFIVHYPNFVDQQQLNLPSDLLLIAKQKINPEDLEKFDQAYLLVADPKKIHLNNRGFWQGADLTILPYLQEPFTINNETLPDSLNAAEQEVITLLEFGKKFSFIFLSIGLITSRFLIIVIDSLFIYLLSKFYGLRLTYQKTLQWSLHIVVIAELVNQISKFIYQNLTLPMFSMTFWGIFIYLFINLRKQLVAKKRLF